MTLKRCCLLAWTAAGISYAIGNTILIRQIKH